MQCIVMEYATSVFMLLTYWSRPDHILLGSAPILFLVVMLFLLPTRLRQIQVFIPLCFYGLSCFYVSMLYVSMLYVLWPATSMLWSLLAMSPHGSQSSAGPYCTRLRSSLPASPLSSYTSLSLYSSYSLCSGGLRVYPLQYWCQSSLCYAAAAVLHPLCITVAPIDLLLVCWCLLVSIHLCPSLSISVHLSIVLIALTYDLVGVLSL